MMCTTLLVLFALPPQSPAGLPPQCPVTLTVACPGCECGCAEGGKCECTSAIPQQTYAEWLESQKTEKPHWWPANASGAGTGEGRTATGGAKSIKRAEFNKLSPTDQFDRIKQGVELRD